MQPEFYSREKLLHWFMMDIQWNVKLMFSIPLPPQWVWAQFTKIHFAENFMNWPAHCQKFNVWQPVSHGEKHWAISLKMFDWSCIICTEMHEIGVFQSPTPPQMLGGLVSNAQNNTVSNTKMLVNCPQLFRIWKLPNMSFLCRLRHFTQFLAKISVEIEHDFCMWIWIFHAILRKKILSA